MADYRDYARTDRYGNIVVRHSTLDPWGTSGWPPHLAREYAQYILKLAEESERASAKVIELTALLEEGPDDEHMEDLALRLIRAGYRKKAST